MHTEYKLYLTGEESLTNTGAPKKGFPWSSFLGVLSTSVRTSVLGSLAKNHFSGLATSRRTGLTKTGALMTGTGNIKPIISQLFLFSSILFCMKAILSINLQRFLSRHYLVRIELAPIDLLAFQHAKMRLAHVRQNFLTARALARHRLNLGLTSLGYFPMNQNCMIYFRLPLAVAYLQAFRPYFPRAGNRVLPCENFRVLSLVQRKALLYPSDFFLQPKLLAPRQFSELLEKVLLTPYFLPRFLRAVAPFQIYSYCC